MVEKSCRADPYITGSRRLAFFSGASRSSGRYLFLLPPADRDRLARIVPGGQRQDVAVDVPVARAGHRQWSGWRAGDQRVLTFQDEGERLRLHIDRGTSG